MTIPISTDMFEESFRRSLWFTRGWTLQELVAPEEEPYFLYSREWRKLGTKRELRAIITDITGIDSDYLLDPESIYRASIARRMSWMSNRKTTMGLRIRLIACLASLTSTPMALLYGEGRKRRSFGFKKRSLKFQTTRLYIFVGILGTSTRIQVPRELDQHPRSSSSCL